MKVVFSGVFLIKSEEQIIPNYLIGIFYSVYSAIELTYDEYYLYFVNHKYFQL